ncbi:hypothetical protein [Knoellia koreensis]|uniref:Uncharacterized protein n=1 Tax=Knoellia koreensis TaxID=2730921 RepID=A0A849H466_9MICO|nr:hypothetical protein [Knoellia sp. DB2414S]NNM44590.1 hypothetical protein [Knoellia sp. DB2414S]
MGFADDLEHPTVRALAAANGDLYSWDSGRGKEVQTAAVVIAMRQLEETVERLDREAGNLQRWAIGLAVGSLAVSIGALVVAIVK